MALGEVRLNSDLHRVRAGRLIRGGLLLVLALGLPRSAGAAGAVDWPWKKKPPHEVTARCSIEPAEIEQGHLARLRATVEAADSHSHRLAYVWSGNGGVLSGNGPTVEVDAGRLPSGVYRVFAAVQDAGGNRAACEAEFQVVAQPQVQPDLLTMSCSSEPAMVEPGAPVRVRAEAADLLGHPLRYLWFTNGGQIEGDGPAVQLNTTDLPAGSYTITGRVEDGLGRASDCVTLVKVEIPPPPPPPPEPLNIAQIVFPRNRETPGPAELARLEAVLERLHTEPQGRISIESYADPDEREPQRLAAARAGMVLRYFLERGISQSRLATVIGLGGRRGGSRNRALDIIWLPDGVYF